MKWSVALLSQWENTFWKHTASSSFLKMYASLSYRGISIFIVYFGEEEIAHHFPFASLSLRHSRDSVAFFSPDTRIQIKLLSVSAVLDMLIKTVYAQKIYLFICSMRSIRRKYK